MGQHSSENPSQPPYSGQNLAITNNKKDFGDTTREAYVSQRVKGVNVVLGQWTNGAKITYRDVSMVLSGITHERMLKLKHKHNQEYIVVIRKNGPPEIV